MGDLAKMAGIRALALAGATFLLLFLLQVSPASSGAETAQTSIINGKPADIKDWPWQVALAWSGRNAPQESPRSRFFCGGSLIAPDLVLTAGHCVADFRKREIGQIEIISGRTRLNNESKGQVAAVTDLMMPANSRGKRRYSTRGGVANWDFALLRLSRSLNAETIKIAGADEAGIWSPGRNVTTTGWGVTRSSNDRGSPILRVASQVMLEDSLCARLNGDLFKSSTMNCMGGPATNTSTCFGDSGGPLVAPIEGGYRLIGATSFGDSECRPDQPSIDTRIAANPMRSWIQRAALGATGTDVVGSGGQAPPRETWCRVPLLTGLTVPLARAILLERGCRLGRVQRDFFGGRRGRITGASIYAGWFAPLDHPIKVWIAG